MPSQTDINRRIARTNVVSAIINALNSTAQTFKAAFTLSSIMSGESQVLNSFNRCVFMPIVAVLSLMQLFTSMHRAVIGKLDAQGVLRIMIETFSATALTALAIVSFVSGAAIMPIIYAGILGINSILNIVSAACSFHDAKHATDPQQYAESRQNGVTAAIDAAVSGTMATTFGALSLLASPVAAAIFVSLGLLASITSICVYAVYAYVVAPEPAAKSPRVTESSSTFSNNTQMARTFGARRGLSIPEIIREETSEPVKPVDPEQQPLLAQTHQSNYRM